MVKNRLDYRKGLIIATVYDTDLYSSFFYSPFWTQSERKEREFFCILNNTAVQYLTKRKSMITQRFIVADEIIQIINDGIINYNKRKEKVYTIKNLPSIKLLDFQEYSINLMLKHHYQWLFLGMGTGKTLIALTYIHSVMSELPSAPMVVVTKKTVIPQYVDEIQKYLPGVEVFVHERGNVFSSEKQKENQIVITNYEQIGKLPLIDYHSIIYDESHFLNGYTSLANKSATKLNKRAQCVYGLTGTPKDSHRLELFSQFKTALPWLAPTLTSFRERYFHLDDHMKPTGEKRPEELEEIIEKLAYGDTTEELLGDELPDVKHFLIECEFKNKKIYNYLEKHKIIFFKKSDHSAVMPAFINEIKLEDLMYLTNTCHIIDPPNEGSLRSKLKQLCNGFLYYVDDNGEKHIVWTEAPKAEAFAKLIGELPNAIVFTQFKPDITIVSKLIDSVGRTYKVVDSDQSDKINRSIIEEFKTGAFDFLVIHNKSGGTGLHVVNTNNIVYYALPESSLLYEQALYRTRRKGQEEDVCYVYSFVVKATVEPRKLLPNLENKAVGNQIEFEIYRRKNDDDKTEDTY